MSFSEADIIRLAALSRLTKEDVCGLRRDFEDIIKMADKLLELKIDTEIKDDAKPLNAFRDDCVCENLNTELFSNAPQTINGCISVPKVKGV